MKYRAILRDPGDLNPERSVSIQTNSMEDVKNWAYGDDNGGMERARGVLPGAVSDQAYVEVFAIEERLVNLLTKKGKPK